MKNWTKWLVALLALTGIALAGVLYSGNAEPAFAAVNSERAELDTDAPLITIYKSPSCTCCAEWAKHLEENGFRVDVQKAGWDLMQIKSEHGIAPTEASCHTGVIGDYVVEGHVPADLVKQMLEEQPNIRGLAVPGMPPGVPGMPEARKNRPLYDVLALELDGSTRIYARR